MGQSHSSSSHAGTGSDRNQPEETKVDYYELLQVEQNASSEEIKKAYRRRALELHPDRNYGNTEAATKLFAEIQSAYEVLSDAQERAWYDSHRDVFLGNKSSTASGADYSYNMRMTTCDDILKLFSKFSPRMDFTDAPAGFYGGLRETFAQLAVEEKMACLWEDVAYVDYPTFGNRDDTEETVRSFYAIWGSFSTKKSFAWKDIYRYSEAPDRRVRRLMEKENKRLREEAIREFNEAVRSLVAFVKKRDPRYRTNTQSESHRQEILRQSAAAQAARSRAANQAKLGEHVIQDWAKAENLEDNSSDTSENEVEHLECIACHKIFKSHNQFKAHERSKKHIKALKQLRWEMRAQNEELDLEGNASDHDEEPQRGCHPTHSNTKDNLACIIEPPTEQTQDSGTRATTSTDEYTSPDSSIDVKLNKGSLQHTGSYESSQSDPKEADYAPREYVEQRLGPQTTIQEEGEIEAMENLSHQFSRTEIRDTQMAAPKMGKAKQKRAKKAQRALGQLQDIKCATCDSTFSSKTRLFTHIREFNHAQPLRVTHAGKKKGG
ncbi:hypothetical protein ETB97_003086 [Aspergillus alliaceus]|uniref:DnaJ domain-containing protein n=1 Tax=Petromyces alliaceus TaxID=209559 RepID=A0A5N6G2X7_PETAA|nr:uncharacterized protein BDW43DRAFT_222096 [Aspergillus alliaceus]KAB8236706.1 hypothetical protein BDW43DRAFT_222096 [Aspergillus alliaceus]KAE8395421.1 hypothetical protein BDV23DRAFT_106505 [Aspergillus alliaceus]KAF5859281.1 hypothetical protein ETB97_003086 [Aspergillus burnettii]